ncbi:hypothetical protein [Haloferula sp. BvORR071]|uniref:hypothetical protein n=1 Tax=Haloferula sp. BvORR071 TaxID=1396141 RepID=UPI00054E6161|nr:hypothetical protein [Haloferula sp. BvORR071]
MKLLRLLPLPALCALQALAGDDLQQTDLTKLADPAQRQAQIARLVGCDGKRTILSSYRLHPSATTGSHEVLQVLTGSYSFNFKTSLPLALRNEYEVEKPEELFGGSGRDGVIGILTPELTRIKSGPFFIFAPDGKEIRPFGSNNLISDGYLFDFDHDGILDLANTSNYAVKNAPDTEITVFTLQSIERKPRTLLRVIYNWHPEKARSANVWSFECHDRDGDSFPEIAFGPRSQHDAGPREPSFTFLWNPEQKAFSTGAIPEHAHIRVLRDDESLDQIADAGGLGYPLRAGKDEGESQGEKEDTLGPATTPATAIKPYVFASLKGLSDAGLFHFFQGKQRPGTFGEDDDSPASEVPAKVWSMPPKQAALAIADANRTPAHRDQWKLAIDDRNGITPPQSGWFLYDWDSSSCYSFSSNIFALRFGTDRCWLLATDYNSNGAVGGNPLADQPGYTARVIPLSREEAGFIAETLFWLDRIRSHSFTPDSEDLGIMSSTADGFGSLDLLADGKPPRQLASKTVWASSISSRWKGDYSPEVCINLVAEFLATALPQHLGDRWRVAPELDRRNLMTPVEARLAPRLNEGARKQLTANLNEAFTRHWADSLPPQALLKLVMTVSEEAILDLRPELARLRDSLPPPDAAQDAEFEALEKRCGPGANFNFDSPEQERKDRDRYHELEEARRFLPGPVLREPITTALAKLDMAGDAKRLKRAIDANDATSLWALDRLRKNFPLEWQDLLTIRFREGDLETRRNLLSTLGAAAPQGGQGLVDLLTPKELDELIIEVTKFELKADPTRAETRVPALLDLIRAHKADYIRRGQAMDLLTEIHLDGEQATTAAGLLLDELKYPQMGEYGMTTLAPALEALSHLPGATAHLDAIQATPWGKEYNVFRVGLAALERLTHDRPDRKQRLAAYIQPAFKSHPGFMDDVFLACLALDLRELAPLIAGFASEGPAVQEGDGANYSGGNFKGPADEHYHVAREITALWSETDPETLDRMWLSLALARSSHFNPYRNQDAIGDALRAQVVEACARLAKDQRQVLVDTALAALHSPSEREAAAKLLTGVAEEAGSP